MKGNDKFWAMFSVFQAGGSIVIRRSVMLLLFIDVMLNRVENFSQWDAIDKIDLYLKCTQ